MSSRNKYCIIAPWLASIIFLLIIAVTYWQIIYLKGYQSARHEHSTYRSERAAQNKYYKKCLERKAIESARECINSAPYTSRDSQRSEEDLEAQREMAQWAEGMLWATWVVGLSTTFITSCGVYFVWETFRETRSTVSILRSEQRPWASINLTPDTSKPFVMNMGIPNLSLILTIENHGKSPAFVGERHIALNHGDYVRICNGEFEWEEASEFAGYGTPLMPNQTTNRTFTRIVNPDKYESFNQTGHIIENTPVTFYGYIACSVWYYLHKGDQPYETRALSRWQVELHDRSKLTHMIYEIQGLDITIESAGGKIT